MSGYQTAIAQPGTRRIAEMSRRAVPENLTTPDGSSLGLKRIARSESVWLSLLMVLINPSLGCAESLTSELCEQAKGFDI